MTYETRDSIRDSRAALLAEYAAARKQWQEEKAELVAAATDGGNAKELLALRDEQLRGTIDRVKQLEQIIGTGRAVNLCLETDCQQLTRERDEHARAAEAAVTESRKLRDELAHVGTVNAALVAEVERLTLRCRAHDEASLWQRLRDMLPRRVVTARCSYEGKAKA